MTGLRGPVRVIVIGSSEMQFTEGDTEHVFPRLLQAALAARRPDISWEVEGRVAYQTDSMRRRCEAIVEAEAPHVVLLWLSGNTLAEETVAAALHRRSPRFSAIAGPLMNSINRLSGGGAEGSPSPRGLLFRAPRALARRLVGQETWVAPEIALAATIETLRALAPRLPLVCRLAYYNYRQAAQRELVRRRVDAYNAVVREECARLAVPCFEPAAAVEERGFHYTMAPDRLHADLPTRRISAEVCADYILQVL